MSQHPVCPGCGGGEFEDGFVLDVSYGASMPADWIEGAPEKSFWKGTKVSGKRRLAIQAVRCRHCGRLELFASDSG